MSMSRLDSAKENNNIVIREVWSHNLGSEFELIRFFIARYPYISMDTEFPGCIYHPTGNNNNNLKLRRNPSEQYRILKSNVDALNLIQLGLTLSDAERNLPCFNQTSFIWQFNFSDFDISRDNYAPDSIELLKCQGINFELNRVYGINSALFAQFMLSSGLILNPGVTWITFHGGYDFGYLLKILTRRGLPAELEDFVGMLRLTFGENMYDVKHLMKFCPNLYGGLDRVTSMLGVNRVVGKCHQAGSDSLSTWNAFCKIRELYFLENGTEQYAGVLYGLEVQ